MTETGHDRPGETPERPTRQPARAPKSPAPDQPYQRFRELTGADRNWVRVLAEILREAPGDLDGLLAPGSEAYRALAEHDDRGGETDRDDPLAPALSFGLRTARVLLEMARALADPDAGTDGRSGRWSRPPGTGGTGACWWRVRRHRRPVRGPYRGPTAPRRKTSSRPASPPCGRPSSGWRTAPPPRSRHCWYGS